MRSFVKQYKPNKRTGKLELVDVIDPFETVTPVNNPFRTYPKRVKQPAKQDEQPTVPGTPPGNSTAQNKR